MRTKKKSSKKQTESFGDDTEMSTNKRKKKFANEPPAKRKKINNDTSDEEEKGKYFQRYRFVLAPKHEEQVNSKSSSEDQESTHEQSHVIKKKKKPKKAAEKNGKNSNGTDKSKRISMYDNDAKEPNSSSIDGSWASDYSSDYDAEEEESCEEEWTTDTDYSEHSFHESDYEELSDSDDDDDDNYDHDEEMEGCFNYNSDDDDDDYAPPIEDKLIKKGEGVFYDAKGFYLAFGDTNESQIIELDDIDFRVIDHSDEEIPKLTPIDGNGSVDDSSTSKLDESPTKLMKSAEATLKNLTLNDDDELPVQSSQLLQRATFYDCSDDKGVIVKLSNKIYFHGILLVRPLVNSIQINGYKLKTNESLKVTSTSRSDYYLNLTPVVNEEHSYDKKQLSEELKNLLPSSCFVEQIIDNLDSQTEVLVHLQQALPDTTVEMLKTYYPHPILPHKNMILENSVCPSSELILSTKFFVDTENPKLSSFKINHDWNYLEMKQNLKLMIIGGKNVGKSALSQYLINKNIDEFPKILLIDLDIGQPIVAPCQTLSATLITKPLIGAGYLSDLTADKCYLFGDKSVMISPFKYNECVLKLIEFCNRNDEYKNIPWIINTMGYQKGFGLQLMCVLLRIVQPTEVVQIQHGNFRYNFKCILKEDIVNNFEFSFFNDNYLQRIPRRVSFVTHALDSLVNNNNAFNPSEDESKWISNASEKRKMSMLAQLSKLLKSGQTYLNDVTPFCTALKNIQMIVMDEEYAQQDNGVKTDLFNGNLVYLCHSDEALDSNSILECYGIGIVRAIDKVHGLMYILMPQQNNSGKLASIVNVLALGNIPLPSEILLKQNYGVNGKVPYITFLKDRNMSKMKYINKRNIKDCF